MSKVDAEQLADINYTKGLERFMGNKEMYHDYLHKFLYDSSFEEFFAGIALGDALMAKKALHTLKGTSANLSLENLYSSTREMSLAMEDGKGLEELSEYADRVNDVYRKTCDAVREYL